MTPPLERRVNEPAAHAPAEVERLLVDLRERCAEVAGTHTVADFERVDIEIEVDEIAGKIDKLPLRDSKENA